MRNVLHIHSVYLTEVEFYVECQTKKNRVGFADTQVGWLLPL